MEKTHKTILINDCIKVSERINEIIDKYTNLDAFCSENRESLVKDLESNTLIKHSPSIIGIIEYSSRNYVYISDNILTELDITKEEIMTVGLGRALMNFKDSHRQIFLDQFYPTMFEAYAKHAPLNEAKDLHMSYTTLLKTSNGHYRWYHHQLAVLAVDDQGQPRYAMKFLSDIHEQKKDERLSLSIYKKSKNTTPELIFSKEYQAYELGDLYSPREKEIINLVSNGQTTKEIAEKLFLSENTVSTHRKNIAKKMKTE